MAEDLPKPKSRKESYLAKAAGMEVAIPEPESREEQYLNAIAEGGGGGTSDFNDLTNRPKYNGEAMTGETSIPEVKTYAAGDGIDITNAVISATNTGKARMLTTDDYNYPANNPDRVAMWLMPNGLYVKPSSDVVTVRTAYSTSPGSITGLSNARIMIKSDPVLVAISGYDGFQVQINSIGTTYTPHYFLYGDSVINNLTSTSTTRPLSANQGKVLKDLVDSLAIREAGAPTTSTAGQVGTLYEDTTNGDLYICTDATNPYVWETVGGGSGVTELTSADYNYPTNDPNRVAIWLLEPGVYKVAENQIQVGETTSGYSGRSIGTVFIVGGAVGNIRQIITMSSISSAPMYNVCSGSGSAYSGYQSTNFVIPKDIPTYITNSLTSTSTTTALAAKQGKVLNDKIGGDLSNLTTTDKTSLINAINELVGQSGGGGVTELTTADYNYDDSGTGTNNVVALWLLEPGIYTNPNSVSIMMRTGYSASTSNNTYVIGETSTYTTILRISGSEYDPFYCIANKTTGALVREGTLMSSSSIVQSTGTSTTSVMSQNAVTGMLFADPNPQQQFKLKIGKTASGNTAQNTGYVSLGNYSNAAGSNSIAIGTGNSAANGPKAQGNYSIAMGRNSVATGNGSIALGNGSQAASYGEMNIGSSDTAYGYNSSNYRLLSGLYDGQSAHDAATVAQGNTLSTSAPATTTVGVLGQLYTDTTNMHTYQCTAIDDTTDPSNPVYTWTQRW